MNSHMHGRRPRHSRGRKGLVFCTTAIATAVLALASTAASAVGFPIGTPTPVDPGFSCRNFDTAGLLREMVVTPVDGARGYNDGTLDLTVVYYRSTSGWILDWYQENFGAGPVIRHAVVEDGDSTAHAFSYDPPVDSDRLLHGDQAPVRIGSKRLQYKPLLRATFCYAMPDVNHGGCSVEEWQINEAWPEGITSESRLRDFFGAEALDGTFGDAMSYPDGGIDLDGAKQTLLRQAVAGLLNANTDWVHYPLTATQVVDFTRFALESNDIATILSLAATLDGYNHLGCAT